MNRSLKIIIILVSLSIVLAFTVSAQKDEALSLNQLIKSEVITFSDGNIKIDTSNYNSDKDIEIIGNGNSVEILYEGDVYQDVIVILDIEPAVSYVKSITSYPEKDIRDAAYEVYLEEIEGISNNKAKKELKMIDAVSLTVDNGSLDKLKRSSAVKAVYPDTLLHIDVAGSVDQINASYVWTMLDSLGNNVTGENITVAVIDSGIDYRHPDLGACTSQDILNNTCQKVIGGYDFVNDDNDPLDDNGHGTHCAGIIAADGNITGVSPKAKLLAYKSMNSGGAGSVSDIIAAIQNATSSGADIISMSLGGSGDENSALSLAVDNAFSQGVIVVVSAGNEGPFSYTVGSPGSANSSLTVGAIDSSDNIQGFSSRGPTSNYNIKPDILAPGYEIYSTAASGSCEHCSGTGYISMSGTSMAAPMVSGVCALIRQMHPSWSNEQVRAAIINTGINLGEPVNYQGTGKVDAYKAIITDAVITPTSKSFGIDESVLPEFNRTQYFTITNIGNTTVNYNLSTTFNYTGVNATLNQSSITIPSGENRSFLLNLYVDNPSALNQDYEGYIIAQGENVLRVPIFFIKSSTSILNLFDDYGNHTSAYINIHDKNDTRYEYDSNSPLKVPVKPGIYDIIARFGNKWVVRENVSLNSSVINISSAEAINLVNYTFRDIDNNTIVDPVSMIDYRSFRYAPDPDLFIFWSLSFSSSPQISVNSLPRYFSNLSEDYHYVWKHPFNHEDEYYDYYGVVKNLNSDKIFDLGPNNTKMIKYHYPEIVEEYDILHSSSCGNVNWESVSSPKTDYQYMFYTPVKDENEYCTDNTLEIIDHKDTLKKYYSSPVFYALNTTHIRSKVSGNVIWTKDDLVYKISESPHVWYTKFDNTNTLINATSYLGSGDYFYTQNFDSMSGQSRNYQLYNSSGNLESSGSLSDIIFSITPGKYNLLIDNVFVLNTVTNNATVNATFDTSLADKNPPSITKLNMYSGNLYSDFVDTSQGNDIMFETDAVGGTIVSANARYYDTSWHDLNLTQDANRYNTTIPAGINTIKIRFNIYLEDDSGNSLDHNFDLLTDLGSDLTPTDIRFFDDAPSVGNTINITADISNIGISPANDVNVSFYDNSNYVGSSIIDTISLSATKSVNFSYIAFGPGLRNITVIADQKDNIVELNETNNQYTVEKYYKAETEFLNTQFSSGDDSLYLDITQNSNVSIQLPSYSKINYAIMDLDYDKTLYSTSELVQDQQSTFRSISETSWEAQEIKIYNATRISRVTLNITTYDKTVITRPPFVIIRSGDVRNGIGTDIAKAEYTGDVSAWPDDGKTNAGGDYGFRERDFYFSDYPLLEPGVQYYLIFGTDDPYDGVGFPYYWTTISSDVYPDGRWCNPNDGTCLNNRDVQFKLYLENVSYISNLSIYVDSLLHQQFNNYQYSSDNIDDFSAKINTSNKNSRYFNVSLDLTTLTPGKVNMSSLKVYYDKADLKILNVTLSSDSVSQGDFVNISSYVKNEDGADIDNVSVEFKLGAFVLDTQHISLASNETKKISYLFDTSSYTSDDIYVTVDPSDMIVEYNESNTIQEPLTIQTSRPSDNYSTGDEAWDLVGIKDIHDFGYQGYTLRGKGQSVCVISTGLDYTHDALRNCTGYDGGPDWAARTCTKVLDGWDYFSPGQSPSEANMYFGTQIAGIIAADGKDPYGNGAYGSYFDYVGIAPDASILGVRVTDDNGGNWVNVDQGIDWCVNHSAQYNITTIVLGVYDDGQPGGVNLSSQGTCMYAAINTNLANESFNYFGPTGDKGYTNGIGCLAAHPDVIAVGSVNDFNGTRGNYDNLSNFTNRVNDIPVLLAPGNAVDGLSPGDTATDGYFSTYFASAYAAGISMLFKDYYYQRYGYYPNATYVKEVMFNTGKNISDPLSNGIYPRVDLKAMLDYQSRAPSIFGVLNRSITANSAIINWTTDENSNTTINYGTTVSLGTVAGIDDSTITHSLTLNSLNNNQTYYYNVTSCNERQNCNTTGPYSFRTLQNPDTTAPLISNVINYSITNQSAIINWTTDENSNTSLNYGTTTGLGNTLSTSDNVTLHSISIGSLTNNTLYYYNITSCDSYSNCNTQGPYSFTTLANDDMTAPIINNVIISLLTNQSAIINWTTDEISNTTIDYGTTSDLGSKISLNNAVTLHSIQLDNLTNNTLYYYNVTSCDSNSNCITLGPYNLTTYHSPTFQKGFTFTSWGRDDYQQPVSDTSLSLLKDTGTEYVSLIVTWYQDNVSLSNIYMNSTKTPSDASIIHAIDEIHSLGMKVMLKPHIDLPDGVSGWRGDIQPDDWNSWFLNYTTFINHYATIAQDNDVELFCIGTELKNTVQRKNDWEDVIDNVRYIYNGPLVYAANHDNYNNVLWWDKLDYIGIDAYFPLTGIYNPTVDQIKAGWNTPKNNLSDLHDTWQKPIIFTEVGFQSYNGTNTQPNWAPTTDYDIKEQVDCYNATLQTFWNETWFYGMYWWQWYYDASNSIDDKNFGIYNKSSEDILKGWYLGSDTTPPVITINNPTDGASLTSGTTSTNIQISTDEDSTCKYHETNSTFNYSNEGTLFNTTGAQSHSFTMSGLSDGNSYTLYYKCKDNNNNINTASTSHTFSVSNPTPPPPPPPPPPGGLNTAPSFLSDPPTQAIVGQQYVYELNVFDMENDPITLSVKQGPEDIIINDSVMYWTPSDKGTFDIILLAKDNMGMQNTQEFSITVDKVNTLPVFDPSQIPYAIVNNEISFLLDVTDADQDNLTFELITKYSGMTLDKNTGMLTWTPDTTGNFNVMFEVNDSEAVLSESFTLRVLTQEQADNEGSSGDDNDDTGQNNDGSQGTGTDGNYIPSTPQDLRFIPSDHVNTNTIIETITWSSSQDNDNDDLTYYLRFKYNSEQWSDWIDLGQSTSIPLNSVFPKGVFAIEVKAYDSIDYSDIAKDTLIVEDNTPPALQGDVNFNIGMLDSGEQGLIDITWPSAQDLDNDPITYEIQFKVNDLEWSSWDNIGNTNIIPINSVIPANKYYIKVRAFDSVLYSDEITGLYVVDEQGEQYQNNEVLVDKNTAPIMNSSILFSPGADITDTQYLYNISWQPAYDPDEDTINYFARLKVNDDIWTDWMDFGESTTVPVNSPLPPATYVLMIKAHDGIDDSDSIINTLTVSGQPDPRFINKRSKDYMDNILKTKKEADKVITQDKISQGQDDEPEKGEDEDQDDSKDKKSSVKDKDIECYSDSDCDENLYDRHYCDDQASYIKRYDPECVHAGTTRSMCKTDWQREKVEDCPYGCNNGFCKEQGYTIPTTTVPTDDKVDDTVSYMDDTISDVDDDQTTHIPSNSAPTMSGKITSSPAKLYTGDIIDYISWPKAYDQDNDNIKYYFSFRYNNYPWSDWGKPLDNNRLDLKASIQEPGTYDVRVKACDNKACSKEIMSSITIYQKPAKMLDDKLTIKGKVNFQPSSFLSKDTVLKRIYWNKASREGDMTYYLNFKYDNSDWSDDIKIEDENFLEVNSKLDKGFYKVRVKAYDNNIYSNYVYGEVVVR